MSQFDDQVGTEARIGFAFRGWQLDTSQAVFSMPELCCDQLLIEWMLRPAGDGQIASPRQRCQFQRVLQALSPVDVARHNG